jgi:hypothetical protein
VLEEAGFAPRQWSLPDAELLLTQRGARVLGVFLHGADGNLLWTNPVLHSVETARHFVHSREWNAGGDRLWLSPEIDLHFLSPASPTHQEYGVPACIDPGGYVLESEDDACITLATGGEVSNRRSGESLAFRLRRTLRTCESPVHAEGLRYCGYESVSELKVTRPVESPARYGIWQLAQLPPGGAVIVPVRGDPELVDYFRTGVAEHCRLRDGCVEFPVTGRVQHKLGLRADQVSGRMGYLRPSEGDGATLMVRDSIIAATAHYADFPSHQRDRSDVAVQLYNDGGDFGGFGEMEHHSAATAPDARAATRDASRTWCYAGPIGRIREIAAELLGVEAAT